LRNIFFSCVILLGFICGLYAQEEVGSDYVIKEDDVISVIVRGEEEYTVKERLVRLDGRIALPMLGEINVSGKTPKQLENEIAEKLKTYVQDPIVQVFVDKVGSHWVTVAGQVGKMGRYTIGASTTVLEILVQAGGPLPTAKLKNIKIVRTINGREVQFPFNYKDAIRGRNLRQNIILENRDYILVP